MLSKLTKLFVALLLLLTLIMVAWYQVDGIPTEGSATYLSGDGYAVNEENNGALIFTPADRNGYGIVIMHGALIKPQSYAKSAAFFAQRGYTVYLPKGPARMSIAAVDRAAERMQKFDIAAWFFIGHSMGGMSSLELITEHDIEAKGVALWATAMPSNYSSLDVPIIFIWGDSDGLLPAERFENSKLNLPENTKYITLHGANHKNFALYSHQFFDGDATIDWAEQIDFANQTTADFFARLQ